MKILSFITLCLLTTFSHKLIFVQEIFRHGARYPIHQVPTDSYGAHPGLRGELTSQGKHMHYILGKIMHDKYWKQLFANTEYPHKYDPSIIYVKSTNLNRTIESAQAQLQGLL